MAAIVIDASALAAVAFAEPSSADVAAELAGAERVVAPPLLWFELANICWKKVARHPNQREWLLRRLTRALDLSVELIQVDYREVTVLALETGLTAYDASYLWLARHVDAELLTLDERLAAAAHKE